MRIQCIAGASLRSRKGFGKETMQRREDKKNPYYRGFARVACAFAMMAVMVGCSGCTKKDELVFSLQNEQQGTETEGQGSESGARVQAQASESAGEPENAAASGDEKETALSEDDAVSEAGMISVEQAEICVHVCGAVNQPGVYELPAGSRVYEAIQAAGGFTDDADRDYVNQAQQLPDAVQLVIPTVEQVAALEQDHGQADAAANTGADDTGGYSRTSRIGILAQDASVQTGVSGGSVEESASGDDGKININTASEAQLCDIPGIGSVRASAIAAYRQEHGAFESIEDIMQVSGIKQGTYDKIKDSIKVN